MVVISFRGLASIGFVIDSVGSRRSFCFCSIDVLRFSRGLSKIFGTKALRSVFILWRKLYGTKCLRSESFVLYFSLRKLMNVFFQRRWAAIMSEAFEKTRIELSWWKRGQMKI